MEGDTNSVINAPVRFGNHAFIGARFIVSKGVTIGERSIFSAGSVVVSDIPADCNAGGNPCKIINYLNNELL